MRKYLTLLFGVLFFVNVNAQLVVGNNILPFDPALRPFYHGVASGDPLDDSVILWTRVTPNEDTEVEVFWKIATDKQFKNVVNQGAVFTNKHKDYTVKVDVKGLKPATTYYYYFSSLKKNSIIGRTRTAPSQNADHLRFGVVSAANYQAGYFSAYAHLANRKDLDAVIHLGDYINEYGGGEGTYGYNQERAERANIPNTELIDLFDYRTRYSLYRLDPDLQAVHKQHPFIAIWDDHESANKAYKDGAENHNEDEGSWQVRKAISKKVFFEWMPIRGYPDNRIYRTINYGDLADVILLDTRLEGREEQLSDASDPNLQDKDRTILGVNQKTWFLNQLRNSKAKWKLIGNQVLFSEFNVGWAADHVGATANELESQYLDIWDGYPAERNEIIDFIDKNNIDNTLILTGDFNTSFAFDVSKNPSGKNAVYNPVNGFGSVAVEFATPSISSPNFDETDGQDLANYFEQHINTSPPNGRNPNPHMKFSDLDRHGYLVLDLKGDKAQADWFYTNIQQKQDYRNNDIKETFGQGWYTKNGNNRLQKASLPSFEKELQPVLAPAKSPAFERNKELYANLSEVFSMNQNLTQNESKLLVQHVSYKPQNMTLDIYDAKGKKSVDSIQKKIRPGIHLTEIALPKLKKGTYLFKITTSDTQSSQTISIE